MLDRELLAPSILLRLSLRFCEPFTGKKNPFHRYLPGNAFLPNTFLRALLALQTNNFIKLKVKPPSSLSEQGY